MEVSLAIFLGSIFTSIIGMVEYFRLIYLNKKFENLDWFLIALGLFNGIGFGFVIWATYNGKNTALWTLKILQYDIDTIIIYFVLNIILMLSVIAGWVFFGSFTKKINKVNDICSEENINEKLNKRISFIAWGILIVAMLSYMLYSKAYGGFSGLIFYSRMIRSGISVVNNKFTFLQRFGGLAFFSSFLFFGLLLPKTIKTIKKSNLLGFILSLFLSIFVLYSWVGRISFIIYLTTFILGFLLYKNKSIFRLSRKLFTLLFIGLFLIIFFDKVLNRSRAGISIIELFAQELSFPVASFIVQFEISEYRWFIDLVVAPIYVLPSRIWSSMLNIETASVINTIVFWGARKGEAGITGSIPVDLLTFSYMQSSVFGILIVGFLWGGFLISLQNIINKIPIKGVRLVLLSNVILNVIMLTVLYADPLHIITRNFGLLIGILVLRIFYKYRLKIR